ncbi:cellulose biosynthesis protein BcsN [Agrobacterium sp. rho-8.1]|nr:cellulose biosynthesis protein BcsN [Agrobacterium sp. rho-8.1]
MLPPEEALIFPPPGGPEVISVISRTFSNAVQQEVFLRADARTPGQNFLKIELFGPQRAEDTGKDGLSSGSLRASTISRQIRSAFPGASLATSAEYLQNAYGAFSYASGKGSGDDMCLYAWQHIRSPDNMRQGFKNLGRINVTLRLCQSGVTTRDLLTVMYNYTITGSYDAEGWNPYGTAQKPPDGMGRSGNPSYPVAANDGPMQPGLQTPPRQPVPERRPVARTVLAQPQTILQPISNPAPSRVVIPSPSAVSPTAARPDDVPRPSERTQTKPVVIPSPDCASSGRGAQGCT